MNHLYKLVLVIVVLGLALPPVFFFSQQPAQIDLPENKTTDTTVFKTLAGNLSVEISDVQAFISFVFPTALNDKNAIERELDAISVTNRTVSLSLNPNGPGYQVSIIAKPAANASFKESGFRMALRLARFQSSASLPLLAGKISFLNDTTLYQVQGAPVQVSSNGKIPGTSVFSYSREKNDFVIVQCSALIVSKNNTLVRSSATCVDASVLEQQPFFGLSPQDVSSALQATRVENVSITRFDSINVKGTAAFSANVSKQDLETELGFVLDGGFSGTSFDFDAVFVNDSQTSLIRSVFQKHGLTVSSVEKRGLAVLSSKTLEHAGVVYDLFFTSVPVSARETVLVNDTLSAVVTYSLAFNEAFYATAKVA